jgi:hypothetical protein
METGNRNAKDSRMIPTWIVMGIGTGGQTMLTWTKARLIERHGGQLPPQFRLLALDTADAVPPVRIRDQDVSLQKGEERVRLNGVDIPALYRYGHLHESFRPWLTADIEPVLHLANSVDEGASQIRRLAVVSFIYHYPAIVKRLEQFLVSLTSADRADWYKTPNLLVLATSWGAGSGLIPLIPALFQSAADHVQVNLQDATSWLLFALPGGNPHMTELSEANAVATLAELSASQGQGGPVVPLPGGQSVSFAGRKLYNHLVAGAPSGEDNSHFGSDIDLMRMLAESAYQIIDTNEGQVQRTQARNQTMVTSARAVRGDLCCFSTQSIVIAEARSADVAQYLESTAVTALSTLLLAPGEIKAPGRHDETILAAATNPRAALINASGRSFLPDLETEVGQSLTADPPRNENLIERINTLFAKALAARLPGIAARAEERAAELWAAERQSVTDEVMARLGSRDLRGADAVVADALARVEASTIAAPESDAAETERLTAELAKSIRKLAIVHPQKANEIETRTRKLVKARAIEFAIRAEQAAREKLEAARVLILGALTELRTQTGAILAALDGIERDAGNIAAAAALEAARQADGTSTRILAAILHYQVLSAPDLRRAYAEGLHGSTPESLSEEAAATLLGGLGSLEDWLGAAPEKITARLAAVVHPYFAGWEKQGIEATLAWLGPDAAIELLRHMQAMCVERVPYRVELLPDAQRPAAIGTLTVPDSGNTVFSDSTDAQLVSSGDPDRVVYSVWWRGLSASSFSMIEEGGRKLAKAQAAGIPFFSIPGFPPLVPGVTAPATVLAPATVPATAVPATVPPTGPTPRVALTSSAPAGNASDKSKSKSNGEVPGAEIILPGLALPVPGLGGSSR